ncbi:MAG: type II toxin-antitoxin system HicA family toxin [Chloroflexi bacterium]|nr:type II toxin-antitoxin system HicA family toxin [Chloroflexota bacterium]
MSAELRGVRSGRAIRAFEKIGYWVDRISGGHYVLKHQTKPPIVLPYHGVVKVGLLMSKIKDAGLTIEEFEKLLR